MTISGWHREGYPLHVVALRGIHIGSVCVCTCLCICVFTLDDVLSVLNHSYVPSVCGYLVKLDHLQMAFVEGWTAPSHVRTLQCVITSSRN